MTQERQRPYPTRPALGRGDGGPGESLDAIRNELENIMDAADHALQSIGPVDAEDYLSQNRQRGGQ